MAYLSIEVEEADYRYLERPAKTEGTSVPTILKRMIAGMRAAAAPSPKPGSPDSEPLAESRWARISQRIQKDPPLDGAGDFVRACSKEFREDFSLSRDEE